MPKIALYLRLSVDEASSDESNSIINQRHLLSRYLDQSPEFQTFQREEFVDDGFSGTSTNRPAFQRLMADVKSGTIRHIIVKDLSTQEYIKITQTKDEWFYVESCFSYIRDGSKVDIDAYKLSHKFYKCDQLDGLIACLDMIKKKYNL